MSELEIWESTIPGRVSIAVPGPGGRTKTLSALGNGSRLRIKSEDRVVAEEQVRDPQNNPFRNGMLFQVGGPKVEGSTDALSDDDLKETFALTGDDFEEVVKGLSEVNVRRLKILTKPVDAARSQVEFLDEYIAEQYKIGGDTPTYREMTAAP